MGHLQSSQIRSQIHILSTGSKWKTLWKEFEIHHFYMKIGIIGLFMGRLIEDCPLLQETS